ncbi:ParB/RepB/Spo0J family partition protein [Gammaproteobacteria bacterium]|nr:ParB/RepB/Spo0J family partition protein [Gammaproteobacteria bacterium]
MVTKKRGLGRGLDALLPKKVEVELPKTGLEEISIECIQPGKYQPRTYFAEESIAELSDSIKAQGIIQPIVLRPVDEGRYEIIAGERRWRAAQLAGLEKVPAVIRTVDDDSALAMSLIENIQREDLNPLEEATALQRLIDDFQFTHQEVADAVGKSRSSVTNTLRLTQLSLPVAEMLVAGDLEMGHARALLTLGAKEQVMVAKQVAAKGLNVRQTEEMIRVAHKFKAGGPRKPAQDADTKRLEQNLGLTFGQPVQIRHSKKGAGKMVISYSSLDELDGILLKIGYKEE